MLPEKLSELRKKKGLSQIELAEALNVSRQAVSRWETGAALPSVDNLLSLREFYNVSLDELLDVREGTADTAVADAGSSGPAEAGKTETAVRRLRRALCAVSVAAVIACVAAIVSISMLIPTAEEDEGEDPVGEIVLDGESYMYGEDGKPLKGESLEGYDLYELFDLKPLEP